jgi:PAS domain S-box-containing protein
MREAKEELRPSDQGPAESGELYRAILRALPVPIAVSRPDEVILYANEAFAAFVETPLRLLAGRSMAQFFEGSAGRSLWELAEDPPTTARELAFRWADGTTAWTAVALRRISIHGVPAILTTAFDTTTLKEVEVQLRREQTTVQAILAAVPDLMLQVSVEATLLDYHGDPSSIVVSPEDSLGKYLWDVLPSEIAAPLLVAIGAARRSGSVQHIELSRELLAGRTRHFEARIAPTALGDFLVIVRDVTERTRAETFRAQIVGVLRETVQEWQDVFDSIESPTLVVTALQRVRRINRAASALLRLRPADCIGLNIKTLRGEEPWPSAGRLAGDLGEAATPASLRVRNGDTGRVWDVIASPIRIAGRRAGAIIGARDVTDLVDLETMCRLGEKHDTLAVLVSGVAHEIRNPLFAMTATLDAIEAELGPRPEYLEYLAILRAETTRMARLMTELVDYGRGSMAEPTPGPLEKVVAEAIRRCEPLAARLSVGVVAETPWLPPLAMDYDRLVQVFDNIIRNAIQHSPPGATVTVGSAQGCESVGGRVHCFVRDHGGGFAPEALPRALEPFFTQRRRAAGLGMAIAHRIVIEHGGAMMVANASGGGAIVLVSLPSETRVRNPRAGSPPSGPS